MKMTISLPFIPKLTKFENASFPPKNKAIGLPLMLRNPAFKNTYISQ